jgi:hypothetical protein
MTKVEINRMQGWLNWRDAKPIMQAFEATLNPMPTLKPVRRWIWFGMDYENPIILGG